MQGNVLARYKVERELGRSATGAVYAARDRTTGALVALKRLDPAVLAADAGAGERLRRHARAAQGLAHAGIVRTLDAGEAAGTFYVVMEMLEGESLRKVLDAGPLPVARAIRIAREVAAGLAHAHLEGVIHAGLKPSNILVLPSGGAKITDFGIAQAAPGYRSPEQARGEPVDHRSDLYSLGAVLYEMLAGRLPAEGAEPAPPSELNPLLPRALDALVLSMLAAQPSARMAGMPILLRELERIEAALGLDAPPRAHAEEPAAIAPPPPAQPAPPPRQARPAPVREPAPEAFEYYRALAEQQRLPPPERSSSSGPAFVAVLALMLSLLAIGLTGFIGAEGLMDRWAALTAREPIPKTATAPVAEAPREPLIASAPPPPPLPPQAEEQKAEAEPLGTGVRPIQPPPEQARLPERPAAEAPPVEPPAAEPPAKTLPPPARRTAKAAPKPQPEAPARLVLAVSPGGDVYIDGEHRGTTPPVTTLEIEPGMRRVEVRNGSRKPFLTYVTVEPGDVRRIRHDFNARPLRPPG